MNSMSNNLCVTCLSEYHYLVFSFYLFPHRYLSFSLPIQILYIDSKINYLHYYPCPYIHIQLSLGIKLSNEIHCVLGLLTVNIIIKSISAISATIKLSSTKLTNDFVNYDLILIESMFLTWLLDNQAAKHS